MNKPAKSINDISYALAKMMHELYHSYRRSHRILERAKSSRDGDLAELISMLEDDNAARSREIVELEDLFESIDSFLRKFDD